MNVIDLGTSVSDGNVPFWLLTNTVSDDVASDLQLFDFVLIAVFKFAMILFVYAVC